MKKPILIGIYGILAVSLVSWGHGDEAMSRSTEPAASVPYVWRSVVIVGGGFVTGIIFNEAERGLMYARTDIGGAYRWDTAGRRWIPLTDWIPAKDWTLTGIESLATDPVDPNRLYLAAGTYTNDWSGNGAILRSRDRGETWERTDMPFKMGGNEDGRSMGERLAVDPNSNNVLFFGSRHNGLLRSTDFGATWQPVAGLSIEGGTRGAGVCFVEFDKRSGAAGEPTPVLYVGTGKTETPLFRSQDAGTNWEPIEAQPVGLLPHHGELASDGMLYVSYGNALGPNGMTDGAVWKLNTGTGEWTNITPVAPGSGDEGGFGYAGLDVAAREPRTVMVSTMDRWAKGDEIFRSTDGGESWKPVGPSSERDTAISPYLKWGREESDLGHWIGDIAIDPFDAGHAMYVTGATIWGCDDVAALDRGETTHWEVRALGLEEISVVDLISPPEGAPLFSAVGDLGGFRHLDLDVSPAEGFLNNPSLVSGTSLDFAEQKPSVIVRVGTLRGPGSHGAYTMDGGATWSAFTSEPDGALGGGSVAVTADGSSIVWSPRRSRPFVTFDWGETWEACEGLNQTVDLASDRVNARKVYALDAERGELFVSRDGGKSFASVKSDLPTGKVRVETAPGSEGEVWITGSWGGLLRSTDSGKSFSRIEAVEAAEALGFGKAAPAGDYPAMYLSGRIGDVEGLFRSEDAGASWVRINDDKHQFAWTGRAVIGDPRTYGRVYVGTNGRGIIYGDPAGR